MPFLKMFQSGNACKPLPTMDAEQKSRYGHFRKLLGHNRTALTTMADLEQLYYNNRPFTLQFVERKIGLLLTEIEGLIACLSGMSIKDYKSLSGALNSIRRAIQQELAGDESSSADALVLPLDRIKKDQVKITGAKAANLAHMRCELALPTPGGFAVTTAAYWYFMKETGLIAEIDEHLANMTADDPASLEATGSLIRERIMETPLPSVIRSAIEKAIASLQAEKPSDLLLAVRSSAVGEDGEVSFAGQYTSVLNVPPAGLAEAYKQVVASKYSASALSYRLHHGLDDLDTPMAALIIEMVQPRLSGVLYTADPLNGDLDTIRISAVEGIGEDLVGGGLSPQHSYRLRKDSFRPQTGDEEGGPPDLATADTRFLKELWDYALRLETHFQRPLDMEWAVDQTNHLFLLQVRPLFVSKDVEETPITTVDYPGHPLLIEKGKCAAAGIATGQVLLWKSGDSEEIVGRIGPDTILVTRTASTMITPWVGKVKGIITDIGSAASHLASVAREFGVPALFDTQIATATLNNGETITLWAGNSRVYKGNVQELTAGTRSVKRPIFASPAHLRMQRLLDLISPLNLTDASSADFKQDNCRTIHDIIRFCHEYSVREMFRFGESTDRERNAVQLKVNIPIKLFALDLGGGLREGLTTCNEINAHDIESLPFRALWRGLSHPGINWTSSIAVGAHNFMSLMAGGSLPQQGQLGGASYSLISNDYMNLSIRFGYHFATVDVLCSDDAELNYAALHFAGGAGAYSGKSLRIQYIAKVLGRLGFNTVLKGELIEASLTGIDRLAMEEVLDQLGRLLGSTRLLDMAIKNAQQIESLTEAFFQGRYDFLEPEHQDVEENFYLITGDWQKNPPGLEQGIVQDGSHFSSPLSASINQTIGRFLGQRRYIEILDNIKAYHYFPLAIAKESNMANGSAQVMVKPLSGIIDQAGGLAFAIRDWANYFVFRVNALENNAVLFEFHNNKRLQRSAIETPIESGSWRNLRIETIDKVVRAYLDDLQVMEYEADRDLGGYVGLWTKADSVTLFKDLMILPNHCLHR
jgi:pyruvate, water dikinase